MLGSCLDVSCWPAPVNLAQGATDDLQYGLIPRIVGTAEDGFCAVEVNPLKILCVDANGIVGVSFASGLLSFPWVLPTFTWHGAVALGSRVYIPQHGNSSVNCFDYAKNALCSGFTKLFIQSEYTVRSDPYHPECVWANSHSGKVVAFDAFTGADCGTTQRFAVKPSAYYCSGTAMVKKYGTLRLNGLNPSDFTGATVALTDVAGTAIPGFTGVPLASGNPTVSLSAIPYGPAVVIGGATLDTTTINVELTFASTVQSSTSWSAKPPPSVSITWDGPPIDALCFQTVVPELCAGTVVGGVAVTTAGGLRDTSGTTTLAPSTASFDYQQARTCVKEGTLTICKVAGEGVAAGTDYTFTVDGRPLTVAAGPAPDGTCVTVATPFPVGAKVVVDENPPQGQAVTIAVTPPERIVGAADVAGGRVTVEIGPDVTKVTFTNRRLVPPTTKVVPTTVVERKPPGSLPRTGASSGG